MTIELSGQCTEVWGYREMAESRDECDNGTLKVLLKSRRKSTSPEGTSLTIRKQIQGQIESNQLLSVSAADPYLVVGAREYRDVDIQSGA